MKILFIFLCILFLGFAPVNAEWVNIQNVKDPIKLLDADNIYKLNYKNTDGTVFRYRYIGKNKKEYVATFFADFENKQAGVISVKLYEDTLKPNYFISGELKMKPMSEYNTNFDKIFEYIEKNEIKDCPEIYTLPALSEQEKTALKKYTKNAESKIKRNWKLPKGQNGAYAVVRLKINREGKMETCEIVQSSQNEMFEQIVLQTLALSEPFGAFPKEYDRDFMFIDYIFGYGNIPAQDRPNDGLYKVNTISNVLGTLLLIPLMILGIN